MLVGVSKACRHETTCESMIKIKMSFNTLLTIFYGKTHYFNGD